MDLSFIEIRRYLIQKLIRRVSFLLTFFIAFRPFSLRILILLDFFLRFPYSVKSLLPDHCRQSALKLIFKSLSRQIWNFFLVIFLFDMLA